jgi:hypothetical protein
LWDISEDFYRVNNFLHFTRQVGKLMNYFNLEIATAERVIDKSGIQNLLLLIRTIKESIKDSEHIIKKIKLLPFTPFL